MSVRSKRLAFWIGGATVNTAIPIYTAGSGETVLLKDVEFYWRTGTAGNIRVGVTLAGGAGTVNLRQVEFTANNQSLSWQPWIVLLPGDVLFARHSVANGGFVYASGAELEGLAD